MAMKIIRAVVSAKSCLLALGVMVASAHAEMIHGRIVGVVDGDTVVLLDPALKQYRVRLQGIDAPESKQPFGQRSKQNLSNLVYGRQVVAECNKQDKYKRSVCKIVVDGKDANLAQVEVVTICDHLAGR
ncbi:MAG: thermonuclease family protein [Rhodocyclaceae bacterium]